jgi:transcription-repair coupling factor (superfamily II helicase)
MNQLNKKIQQEHQKLYGVPYGYDALYLARRVRAEKKTVVYVASDDTRLEEFIDTFKFFAQDIDLKKFPAWDSLPYDRVSPTTEVMGERLKCLWSLGHEKDKPQVIVTTAAAVAQRVVPRASLAAASFAAHKGGRLDMKKLQDFLIANGYHRTETVREAGEYALRGGLIDIFPSGAEAPLRIDCFGDDIEEIRAFDPLTQISTAPQENLTLYPVSEVLLNDDSIQLFRARYREAFGAVRQDDALYESISAGTRFAGMEHWLPFFYPQLDLFFDYLPASAEIYQDDHTQSAIESRLKQVEDLYQARLALMKADDAAKRACGYRPAPLALLFPGVDETLESLAGFAGYVTTPFQPTPGQASAGGVKGRDFGDIRARDAAGLYDAIVAYVQGEVQRNNRVLLAAYSAGAVERLKHILSEAGLRHIKTVTHFDDGKRGSHDIEIAVVGIEHGFACPGLVVLTEQDMLGDRLTRIGKKKKKSDAFLYEISQLHEGDYVVHDEHGVGQFERLETVIVDNIPHDCLKLIYAGGDKLYVPVENLDVLSRYGSAEAGAVLDKLGGGAWQARKARVKRDLLALAHDLLKIAAERILRQTDPVHPPEGPYKKFESGFPYAETEEQQKAIDDVLEDLAQDRPMDRLICGDVGFGKTEVALRAAAAVALSGGQVAVIAPTTLLARQHYQGFQKRFAGFGLNIGLLSRFVTPREAEKTKDALSRGDVQIVIGTHALLAESIKFSNLMLLVVDEEQKFGVKQKERLKAIQDNVHVLTLTATPIPRTLQMALTGVRELSLITTAPIDRLAVKTFVLPNDAVVIRDALMREHFRGGQSFYVCPRIADLADLEKELRILVPELKMVVAHGQMTAEEMEEKMTAFYEGAYDILLSTNIVESGLDIPNANTMIIHRADMFGLAQLYQLRGRIGRSKQRAYAYLTYEQNKKLTKMAEQRLHAIEQLDTLGAGFQLASHDLDIRGAGNLLGEEQSGHIREIGVELYQQMLEEAVAEAKTGAAVQATQGWSPHINLGTAVMIPDHYVPDLNLRLSIYRRIAALQDKAEIESMAAEMIDRFGPLPGDVENLLEIVAVKQLCRQAGIARVDAGPKGAVVTLHVSSRIDIPKLVQYISKQGAQAKIRPEDQKLVFTRNWEEIPARVRGVQKLMQDLAGLI